MDRFGRILQSLVRDHTGRVIGIFALAGVIAAFGALHVEIDTSVDNLLVEGDPDRAKTEALKLEFSNDEVILIAFDLGHPFNADDLRKLHRISLAMSEIDGVEEVLDLTTIKDVRRTDDLIDASPLVRFSELEAGLEELRVRVRNHRLYVRSIVSEDLEVLALLGILEPFERSERAARIHSVTESVLQLVDAEGPPWKVYFGGYPPSEYEADRVMRRDVSVLTGAVLVGILGVVLLANRKRFAVLLLGLLIAWTELVTFGWLGFSETPLSPVTSVGPTLIVATAATYLIYLLGMLGRVSERAAPGVAVVGLMLRPVVLSSLSTGIGFLALRFIDVRAIGQLGTMLAVAICAASLGALLMLPAIIHRFDLRFDAVPRGRAEAWSQWGVAMARRPHLVLAVALLCVGAALPGIQRIRFDTDILRQFKSDNRLRVSDELIRRKLSGSYIFNVVLRTHEAGGALDPEVLEFADSMVRYLDERPEVDRTISLLDYLYLIDAALHPGEVASLPASRAAAAQYLVLYDMGGDPADYRHYLNHDRSALNMLGRNYHTAASAIELYRGIDEFAEARPDGTTVEILGTAVQYNRAMVGITHGVIRGLGAALAVIAVTIAVVLRSLRLTIVAILPNVIPILICAGVLGWSGLPLSMGTSLVGCIALGLAVDDTAHVLGHVTRRRGLDEVYAIVGRPLLLTTLALGLGFSALMLSEFETLVVLGVATGITLLLALLCDLLLLPSLLVLAGYPRLTPGTLGREPAAGRAPSPGSGAADQ